MILAMILQSATTLQPNTHHIPPPVPAPLAPAHPQQVVEAAHQRAHESVVVQKKRTSMDGMDQQSSGNPAIECNTFYMKTHTHTNM